MAQKGFPWNSNGRNGSKDAAAPQKSSTVRTALDSPKIAADWSRGVGENPNTLNEKVEDSFRNGRAASTFPSMSTGPPMSFSVDGTVPQTSTTLPIVRTIPPWIRSVEERDLDPDPYSDYVPHNPSSAFVAHHNHSPYPKHNLRLQDDDYHYQDGQTLPHSSTHPLPVSRWLTFAKQGAYPKEFTGGEKVDARWINEHLGDYSKPWLADHNEDDVEGGSGRYHAFRKQRKVWWKRYRYTVLRNPYIPLAFRLTVLFFAIIALALGGSIHHLSNEYGFNQGPSAEMAIIVDVLAIVYTLYITYDEYRGKPLGLRSASAKIRIILLDLFFIVFESANLALAFQSLSNVTGACVADQNGGRNDITNDGICRRQESLAFVLLVALIAWLTTFSVSVLRLVERVVQK